MTMFVVILLAGLAVLVILVISQHSTRGQIMFRRFAVLLVLSSGALLIPASAQAGCNLSCKVNRLTAKVNRDDRAISILVRCLSEAPITVYGDSSSGYTFDPGTGAATFTTSALDITNSGDAIQAWVMTDTCNSTATAARAHPAADGGRRSLSPFQGGQIAPAMPLVFAPQQHHR